MSRFITRRRSAALVVLVLVVCPACSTVSSRERAAHGSWPHTIRSGEWIIQWSAKAAIAWQHGRKYEFPIYTDARDSCATWSDRRPCPRGWFLNTEHHLLSAMANLVSYSTSWEGSGGAHPVYGSMFQTVDLDTGQPGDITQIADEADVVAALLAEPLIQKYYKGNTPSDLDDLIGGLERPCEISFADLPSHFRLKAIRGDRMTLEFGLQHGCETMRRNFTRFAITVPIPTDVDSVVREAAANLPVITASAFGGMPRSHRIGN